MTSHLLCHFCTACSSLLIGQHTQMLHFAHIGQYVSAWPTYLGSFSFKSRSCDLKAGLESLQFKSFMIGNIGQKCYSLELQPK